MSSGRPRWRLTPLFVAAGICLAAILSLGVGGCGGSSSSSSTSSEGGFEAESSAQFLKQGKVKKSNEEIVKFGDEGSVEEGETVNAIVAANLKARAAGDFAAQCETLDKNVIVKIPGAKNLRGYAAALKELAKPLSRTKKEREDTLDDSIDVLRVKGKSGYALYHGTDGKDWAVPLEKEGENWKVAALLMIEL
jgi:hypothetical protein